MKIFPEIFQYVLRNIALGFWIKISWHNLNFVYLDSIKPVMYAKP
jgi:hypothetical protein